MRALALILAAALVPPLAADTLRDDLGLTVALAPAATRIVSLSPHATELVQAAGAAQKLVAGVPADGQLPRNTQAISTFPGLDRERLLQLQPDLVIAWGSGNRATDLAWLDQQGMRVYRSQPTQLADIARNLRDIGQLAGTFQIADAAARRFEDSLASACTQAPLAAQIRVWDKPTLSVGGEHWLNDVLAHAGLKNVYAELERGIFALENEAGMLQAQTQMVSLQPADKPALHAPGLARPGVHLGAAIAELCRQQARGG